MDEISNHFNDAVRDYRHFRKRGYPAKNMLNLICDRYQLSAVERAMLFRGISTPEVAMARQLKLSGPSPAGSLFHVDYFNQCLIVVSYLAGNPVFISCDGILRDTSGFYGKKIPHPLFHRAVELIFNALKALNPAGLMFYADLQVTQAAQLAGIAGNFFHQTSMNYKMLMTRMADRELASTTEGIICTADSEIIDQSDSMIFDLARYVLEINYSPSIPDLREVCKPGI